MELPERLSDGTLPAYAWPGGYPIYYLDNESEILCAECAAKTLDPNERLNFKAEAADIHYEGAPLQCSHCYKEIESAYGDPEAEETEEKTAQS